MDHSSRLHKAIAVSLLLAPSLARANSFFTVNNTTADAFLATGSPSNPVGTDLTSLNFGGAGTLAISPASSTKGQFDSIIKFNLASAVSQFNGTYGVGNWRLVILTLQLASNFSTQGSQPGNTIFNTINAGNFDIQWLSNDSWVEGTGGGMGSAGFPGNSQVSFNSIPTLFSGSHDSLGSFTYTPPGTMTYINYSLPLDDGLVADATAGGDVSLYFSASSGSAVGYLYNARSFASNHPEFTLEATPAPEPGTVALLALAGSGFFMLRRQKNKK